MVVVTGKSGTQYGEYKKSQSLLAFFSNNHKMYTKKSIVLKISKYTSFKIITTIHKNIPGGGVPNHQSFRSKVFVILHSLKVRSDEPLANVFPSGEKAKVWMRALWFSM
jgi:hypothetical protein